MILTANPNHDCHDVGMMNHDRTATPNVILAAHIIVIPTKVGIQSEGDVHIRLAHPCHSEHSEESPPFAERKRARGCPMPFRSATRNLSPFAQSPPFVERKGVRGMPNVIPKRNEESLPLRSISPLRASVRGLGGCPMSFRSATRNLSPLRTSVRGLEGC